MRQSGFEEYIDTYGWIFNKKACEYAMSLMKRVNPATGKKERVEPMTKDMVEDLLSKQGVKLENNKGWDYVYVAAMCKADYWKSAIEDDQHLAKFVKDTIDDIDAAPGTVFRVWVAKMCAAREFIPWDELI